MRARVAVIGAGPCGLAVARELVREGHSVAIFDAAGGVGGAWRFDPAATDADPTGASAQARRVHSSMWSGLRTNQPRHVMGLCDFPFSPAALGPQRSHDPRAYPLHTEVLGFCEALADAAGLNEHLQLHTCVVRIDPVAASSSDQGAPGLEQQQQAGAAAPATPCKWRVLTQRVPDSASTGAAQEWLFDAVACCVGIFSQPHLPQVPGMDTWPGLQLHSHNYRGPQPFKGKNVMVVGASFSGEEIARSIASEAKWVFHSARTFSGPGTARQQLVAEPADGAGAPAQAAAAAAEQQPQAQEAARPPPHKQQGKQSDQQQQQQGPEEAQPQGPVLAPPQPRPNLTRMPLVQQLRPDGSACFPDGQVVRELDAVVWCTGYSYHFPFIDHLGLLEIEHGCVKPLFAHMFIPAVGASLALCGLPWRSLKFPQFQLQGQLLARLLSGKAQLPPRHVMEQDQQAQFAAMRAQGIPLRYTHCMAAFMPHDEFSYADQLLRLAGGNDGRADGGSNDGGAAPAAEQQQQQQQGLVRIPEWMKAVAQATSGSILCEPDTFRDKQRSEVQALMRQAEEHMAAQLC